MRRQINNMISVVYSAIRFTLLKLSNPHGIDTAWIERFSPNVVIEVNKGGKLHLGNKVRVHSGCKIKVRKSALLDIGDGVKVNYNCIFVCRKEICIGRGTEFGPNVLIYDHDHDYRAGLKEGKFKESPVKIGENCWIGANTVILKGTVLGNNCVVAAGSVLSGVVPDGSIIIQNRSNDIKKIERK